MSMTEEVAGHVHLYPGIADTHTHLILWQTKEMDWKNLFQTCVDNGLELALDVGTNTDTFQERLGMVNQFKELYITDGLSVSKSELEPADLKRRLDDLEKQVAANRDGNKLVAVGEIGLDNHFEYGGVQAQKELFAAQLDIAKQFDLPVIIHTREADPDTYSMLADAKLGRAGIIHCFSSDWEWARKYLDLGFYISFSGNVTYKKSECIQEAAAKVPAGRILAETDAPFLTPQKVRKYPNWSGFVGYTYDCIAALRGTLPEELAVQVCRNFKTLMGLPL